MEGGTILCAVRVSPRTPWGASGGKGTGVCPAGCGVAPWGVRGDRLWVVLGCLGLDTGGHLCHMPLPPGWVLGVGAERRQRC